MVLMLGMVGAACGGATEKGTTTSPSAARPLPTTASNSLESAPPCAPSGTTLQISANVTPPGGQFGGQSYDKDCLAAPASTAFKIDFDNKDSERHNVSIYTNIGASTALFKGKIVKGPKKITYDVKALAAGTYYFHCDVHPQRMNGPFLVSG